MNGAFNSQILVEKLVKLNHTQQSIETLSHWCIFHRKKAAEIVDTWARQFHETPKELQVPFLYLANDILQNSRRKGGEFVHEFWRVLSGALKAAAQNGDEKGRSTVLRLVDIWEERKVFGTRAHGLGEELLGKDLLYETINDNGKDNYHLKARQSVGGLQEKLNAAYRYVQDMALEEEETLGRCNAATVRIEGLGREVDLFRKIGGGPQGSSLADELVEQQNILANCVEHLEKSEGAHAGLMDYLKEALREQETKVGLIRSRLQMAQAKLEYAGKVQQQLMSSTGGSANNNMEQYVFKERSPDMVTNNLSEGKEDTSPRGVLSSPSFTSLSGYTTSMGPDENNKSAVAAEIAAKLAASASSAAQVLTSALSSLAAEEASTSRMATLPIDDSESPFVPGKRQRIEESNLMHSNTNSGGVIPSPYIPHPPPPPPPPLPSDSYMSPGSKNASPPLPPTLPPPSLPSYIVPNTLGGMNMQYRGGGFPLPPHLMVAIGQPSVPQQSAPPPPPIVAAASSSGMMYSHPPMPSTPIPWH